MNTTRIVWVSLGLAGALLGGCTATETPVAGRGDTSFTFDAFACRFKETFESLAADPSTIASCASCAANAAASMYTDGNPQPGLDRDYENCTMCGASYVEDVVAASKACAAKLTVQTACSNSCPAGTHPRFDPGAVTYDACTAYNCPCVDAQGCVHDPQSGQPNSCATAVVGPPARCKAGETTVSVSRNGGGYDCTCATHFSEPASCNAAPAAVAAPGGSEGPPVPTCNCAGTDQWGQAVSSQTCGARVCAFGADSQTYAYECTAEGYANTMQPCP